MSNSQLAEIDASLQAIVRRAYDLGRGDALKKIIDVLNADQTCSEQLALMAPNSASLDAGTATATSAGSTPEPASVAPWWAWPVR